jgi:hypothetical protein
MRRTFLALVLIGLSKLVGCSSTASTNPTDYLGEYIFAPASAVPGEFPSFLVLNQNHVALEIRVSKDTNQTSTTTKNWYLDHGTDEEVVIDKRAYPIERTSSGIRLVVNGDLGQAYEKVR